MKQFTKPTAVTLAVTALGAACMGFRLWLFATGVDQKGLLTLSHWGNILCWVCVAAMVAALVLCTPRKLTVCFPPVPGCEAGPVFLALGCVFAIFGILQLGKGLIYVLSALAGAAYALCALLQATAMHKHKVLRPAYYVPGVVFLLAMLVCHYQKWSAEPELQRYFFQLMAVASLMITAYYRAAIAAALDKGKAYLPASRCALFFSIAAIAGSGLFGFFYVGAAICLLLDGCDTRKAESLQQE